MFWFSFSLLNEDLFEPIPDEFMNTIFEFLVKTLKLMNSHKTFNIQTIRSDDVWLSSENMLSFETSDLWDGCEHISTSCWEQKQNKVNISNTLWLNHWNNDTTTLNQINNKEMCCRKDKWKRWGPAPTSIQCRW